MQIAVIEPPAIIARSVMRCEDRCGFTRVTRETGSICLRCWYDFAMSQSGIAQNTRLHGMLERLLIGAGVLLLLLWGGISLWGQWSSRQQLADFSKSLVIPEREVGRNSQALTDRDAATLPAGSAVGVLRIDRVDLEVPLFEGVTAVNLNRGVARIEGTARLQDADNIGIAGHRDSFFRPLKDIVVGDLIELESRIGARIYRVVETLIVEPEDVWVLDSSTKATLTLVTCYPFYFVGSAPQRFIVRADALPQEG